ncbi:hypothetical protein TRFO_25586 [Tritrichomonas foetus]|uniref:Uncharacterized protein n=1 Tax=Tritrichomonas foetus TaxID=1144522 RepID=A0A1J4K9F6_9EUKA|nr:hypothetical protein TRFO_25586 [Tritrichomonas foetus]|eukprot:OHT06324.1 hypothetical protein TRFO_25586 [Tritrichomonas foetus]
MIFVLAFAFLVKGADQTPEYSDKNNDKFSSEESLPDFQSKSGQDDNFSASDSSASDFLPTNSTYKSYSLTFISAFIIILVFTFIILIIFWIYRKRSQIDPQISDIDEFMILSAKEELDGYQEQLYQ